NLRRHQSRIELMALMALSRCLSSKSLRKKKDRLSRKFYGKVYIQTSSSGQLLPVMVFIHGGGFTSGSGKAYSYGPLYLMDKDVVMVAMNYRLGVFGEY
ncbi:hypothetical protein ANN_27055, partial [Periplaneta americana]